MLQELYISNFAIIDNLQIKFASNLNIFTGETGAGKSILIDAIQLGSGARAKTEYIKNNKETASIVLVFHSLKTSEFKKLLEDNGIPESKDIIIRRIISRDGTNKNFINDIPVTLNLINNISGLLLEIHTQNQQQTLFNSNFQMNLLDSLGQLDKYNNSYKIIFDELKNLEQQIESIINLNNISEAEIDWKKHQFNELEKANLKPGELDKLQNEVKLTKGHAELINAINTYFNKIEDNDSYQYHLNLLKNNLEKLNLSNKTANNILDYINNINQGINELENELQSLSDSIETNNNDPDVIENRIFTIQSLLRKYKKTTVEELLEKKELIKTDLDNIESAELTLKKLNSEKKRILEKLINQADVLSKKRKSAAKKISKELTRRLQDMAMKHAVINIKIEFDTTNISSSGCDNISFLIKTNKGENFKPLKHIASGGELSRIMLVIKSFSAQHYNLPVVILDEIDTGISGGVAEKVAKEIQLLAKNHQVMCITHQPAIASLQGKHFKISKSSKANSTNVNATVLDTDYRIKEIAELAAGGHYTESSKKLAQEMLKRNSQTSIFNN